MHSITLNKETEKYIYTNWLVWDCLLTPDLWPLKKEGPSNMLIETV